MKILSFLFVFYISSVGLANAAEFSDFGFNLDGKAINPACINMMQNWISEDADSPSIVQSIDISSCQNSNIAYKGIKPNVSADGVVSYYENDKDPHSYFGYSVIGKLNNLFVLAYSGHVGLYKLEHKNISYDFVNNKSANSIVLTKISDSWVPCIQSIKIENSTLIIRKRVYDGNKPTAYQCTESVKILKVDLSNF